MPWLKVSVDKERTSIVFVISDLEVGGAQRVLTNLANQLVQENYSITLVTLESMRTDYFHIDRKVSRIGLGVRVIRTPVDSTYTVIKRSIDRVRALRRAIKASQAKCVVSFLGRINVMVIVATMFLGKKVIISERNDPQKESLGGYWDILRRKLYRHADLVTANSRGALIAMSSYVPREKLCYVPNVRVKPVVGSSAEREKWILAVGRLEQQKGYDVLLRAFGRIHDKLPDWRLVIIGEGSLRDELENLAGDLGINQKKIDWVGETDPYPYYYKTSIYVLPSRYEGAPNAMLEAMDCGAAVIVSDASSGPLEYVSSRQTGIIVPTEDHTLLSVALEELMTNTALRERLAHAAKLRLQNEVDAVATWKTILNANRDNPMDVDQRWIT